jgi:predicted phosphodiesterase
MSLRDAAKNEEPNRRIRHLERKLEEAKRKTAAAEMVAKEMELLYRDSLVSKFKLPKQRKRHGRPKKTFYRVAMGDTHGASIDPAAWAAFIGDMEQIKPKEIIHLGDVVDCGGWLAQHQTMGYLAEVSTSYSDDISAANQMWDSLQSVCPQAAIHAIEGNHDMRVEKWCISETLRHSLDAGYLASLLAPQHLTHLEKRGIQYYKRNECYHGLKNNSGSIVLGNCAFTHPQRASKHHASRMAEGWGMNVVYGHTHRRDYAATTGPTGREWAAWSPGCLCVTRKYWHHSENFGHNQGYHLQIVQPGGDFLGINVPIIDGKSYLADLLGGI